MSAFIPGSLNVEIFNILCMFLMFDKNFLNLGFQFFQPSLTNSYAVETRDADSSLVLGSERQWG